jgi:hypothetical protein
VAARPLVLSRAQILAQRRRVAAIDERLPPGEASLRRAASAGLQDSMPRAALLSIHARVEGTGPGAWEEPPLVQVWGPRFSAYVIAAEDRALFTLGRLPDDDAGRAFANEVADDLEAFLAGRRMTYGEVGHGLGINPNRLRYAAPTGRVLIRWDGARRPTVWTVPAPDVDPVEARLELARRHLHVFGPTTAASFSDWAGIKPNRARSTLEALAGELTPVWTPIEEAWILTVDEAAFRAAEALDDASTVRLLPSGDTYFLLQGADRELLVPDADRRPLLWTSRVWPGAVLVGGEVVGTWRRAGEVVTVHTWRQLPLVEREAIVAEVESLPLPDIGDAGSGRGRRTVRFA